MTKSAIHKHVNFDLMRKQEIYERTKTVEDQKRNEFESFQTDAAMTVISSLGDIVSDLAMKVADMIERSAKSEHRARYTIL